MKSLTASIFPETLPNNALIFPLVQVFDKLVYCQPVENDLPLDKEALGYQERVTLHTPAVLGENRDRFLHLVNNLKNHGSDYINQIGNLTIAGLQQGEKAESGNAILTSLLSQSQLTEEKEETAMLLWQSRLILKLAEFYDIEQAELQTQLESMSAREESLLFELREDLESSDSATQAFPTANTLSEQQLHYRLRAWARLFFQGEKQLPAPDFFITPRKNGLELLAESYEKSRTIPPTKLLSMQLPLPMVDESKTDKESLEKTSPLWSAPLAELIENIHLIDKTEVLSSVATLEKQAQELNTEFPVAMFGRCTLEIFFFPEITARELFHSVLGDPAPSSPQSQDKGVLVGCLS